MKIIPFLILAAATAFGQAPTVTPPTDNKAASKQAFADARAAGGMNDKAVALMKKAAELDPDNCDAQQYYILYFQNNAASKLGKDATDEDKTAARKAAGAEIEKQYLDLVQQHPDVAGYRFALGSFYLESNPGKSRQNLEEAVRINPKCAGAYDMLAVSAEAAGDLPGSREFNRKAVESDPTDVTYWRHYVGAMGEVDTMNGLKLAVEMGKRFPDDAASIAEYVANRPKDEAKSREAFEFILKNFPNAPVSSVTPLFYLYLKQDHARALAFAQQLAARAPDDKTVASIAAYGKAVCDADDLIAAGKGDEALAALQKATLPRFGADRTALDVMLAKAMDAAGKAGDAYSKLLATVAAHPRDESRAELVDLGKKLGKDAPAVDAEVAAARLASAKPGTPFSLVDYFTGKTVSLDDFKGRVVLVTFWFPFCGPCRGEFPYFQAILDKYKDRGFAILAINGIRDQDDLVKPLISGWKLGFEPLGGTDEIVKAYHVGGFPSNFLYGADGRIYFHPRVVGAATMREMELQIEGLMAQANPSA